MGIHLNKYLKYISPVSIKKVSNAYDFNTIITDIINCFDIIRDHEHAGRDVQDFPTYYLGRIPPLVRDIDIREDTRLLGYTSLIERTINANTLAQKKYDFNNYEDDVEHLYASNYRANSYRLQGSGLIINSTLGTNGTIAVRNDYKVLANSIFMYKYNMDSNTNNPGRNYQWWQMLTGGENSATYTMAGLIAVSNGPTFTTVNQIKGKYRHTLIAADSAYHQDVIDYYYKGGSVRFWVNKMGKRHGTYTTTFHMDNYGGDQPHNNMPPFQPIHFIKKKKYLADSSTLENQTFTFEIITKAVYRVEFSIAGQLSSNTIIDYNTITKSFYKDYQDPVNGHSYTINWKVTKADYIGSDAAPFQTGSVLLDKNISIPVTFGDKS